MDPIVEAGHAGGFLLSEAAGNRARDNIVLAEGENLKAGAVIALLDDEYVELAPGASDDSKTAAAVLYAATDATDAATAATAITRDAEVNGNELVWPDGITDEQKATAKTELASVGIIVRSVALLALVLGAALMAFTGHLSPETMAVAPFVAVGMLDVFRQDAFSVMSLTDAINKVPFVPGRAGVLIPWGEQGVPTTNIALEEISGELKLVNPTPRGGPGETVGKEKRTMRTLTIPHYQVDDSVMADEVQGVRAFGSENQVQTVFGRVQERMSQHVMWRMDPTLEHQRIGAVKGVIVDGGGNEIYDLFDEFGVSQIGEIDFDLDNANPASGALRKKCAGVVRDISDELAGVPLTGVHAFCGNAFFDDLLSHVEVVESYKGTPMAQVLREGYVYPNGLKVYGAFEFGGIVWENYRGSVGGSAFVHTDKCHIFPIGTPGLFRTVYAPADYIETVNTVGLPRYAKQYEMANGKGVHLETQMNALSYCVRPRTLIQGKRT